MTSDTKTSPSEPSPEDPHVAVEPVKYPGATAVPSCNAGSKMDDSKEVSKTGNTTAAPSDAEKKKKEDAERSNDKQSSNAVDDNQSVVSAPPPTELQRSGARIQPLSQPGAQAIPGRAGFASSNGGPNTAAAHANDETTQDANIVSAFVVEEVDEEMQAKAAEEKARESLLQGMVQGEVVENNDDSKAPSTKAKVFVGVGFLVAFVVIVVLLATLTGGDDKPTGTVDPPDPPVTQSPSEAPLSDFDYLVDILSPISGEDLLLNTTSSQYQALKWLVEDDEFFNTIQNATTSTLVERYVLAVLYFSTQGDDWSSDLSFLSSNTSVCEWPPVADGESKVDGVDCNSNQQVTNIILTGMNLNGTLPAELGQLRLLRQLEVNDNLLVGTLPDELSQLEVLAQFSAQWNAMSGTIPESYGSLNNLVGMGVSGNFLSGTLPASLFQIESLESFTAEWNLLGGQIPEVRARGRLENLWLGGNQLEGTIPASLYTSTELLALSLYENMLTGTLPGSIGALTKLFLIYVDGNNLNGTLPTELGLLRSMEFMWLNSNDLTGTIPNELGELGKFDTIVEFILHSNELLSGELPTELGLLTSLFTMDFASTNITGNLDPIFCEDSALAIPKLTADCGGDDPEVTCSCCTSCCVDDGPCSPNIELICSRMADQVMDPDQPVELVIVQDDVKPQEPTCECIPIPPSANETSLNGNIPVMTLTCDESPDCTVCTPDGSVCGRRVNFGFTWDEKAIWTHQTMGFQYTKGLDDLLLLEFDISSQSPPYPEAIYLNGQRCNELDASATCADGFPAFEVDCSNVQDGAVYSQCDGLVDNAGVLEYFTPSMYGVLSSCEEGNV